MKNDVQTVTNVEDIVKVYCDVDERETSLLFGADDECIQMYTSDNKMVNKMKQLMKQAPDIYTCKKIGPNFDKPSGYFFYFPVELLSFRTKKKTMTDAQREAAADRMRRLVSTC